MVLGVQDLSWTSKINFGLRLRERCCIQYYSVPIICPLVGKLHGLEFILSLFTKEHTMNKDSSVNLIQSSQTRLKLRKTGHSRVPNPSRHS
jgi:hypothetical protein